VTRRGGLATSAGGEATAERENGGDDASWVDTVDSAATKGQ
jgi:hypothetical protein